MRFFSAMRISQTVLLLADDSPLSNVICFIRRYPEHARNQPNFRRSVFGHDESSLICCSVAVVASRCLFALVCLFFLWCMVDMLVNAGQEMDSARDCKYKFSINLVKKKPEYRTNPVN